uniref:Short ORF n=1 Tax=Brevibacillus brevis TaxID=1393 RepID=Q44941_BREBE|nr:short ORF [Brevibacillus brevis]
MPLCFWGRRAGAKTAVSAVFACATIEGIDVYADDGKSATRLRRPTGVAEFSH